jgi:hypothetical protein
MFNLANNLKAAGRNADAVEMYRDVLAIDVLNSRPSSFSCTQNACRWSRTTSCSMSCRPLPWTALVSVRVCVFVLLSLTLLHCLSMLRSSPQMSAGHVTDSLRCFATGAIRLQLMQPSLTFPAARRLNPDQRIATWERIYRFALSIVLSPPSAFHRFPPLYSTATRAKAASLLAPPPLSISPRIAPSSATQASCIPASCAPAYSIVCKMQ